MAKKISIIIPVKEVDSFAEECLRECKKLDYPDFEIILLPDSMPEKEMAGVKVIATGPVKPSAKRNLGAEKSKADLCAFIDSDAYPEKGWLKKAVVYFQDPSIAAVGGPNLTPPNDPLLSRISGDILSNPAAAGIFALRYKVRAGRTVKELPSCNLIVEKKIFDEIGGFDTSFLTAEDSKLCFEIRKKGRKVFYAEDVRVLHHRRPLFRKHLRQMWVYGRDKGLLIREFLSFGKLYYFLPSLFLISLISLSFLSAAFYGNPLGEFSFLALVSISSIYLLTMLLFSIIQNPRYFFLVLSGSVLTHIFYGLGFIYGLLVYKKGVSA